MQESRFYSLRVKEKTRSRLVSKTYEGKCLGGDVHVTVSGAALDPRFDLRNHSPAGFEWGYGGSGPAQLALAILADHLGDDGKALRLYQDFKFAVVAKLPRQGWKLTTAEIEAALAALESRLIGSTGGEEG